LDTKLSGVQMPSAGKRDSLLGRAAELKDQSAKSLAKPVSVRMQTCFERFIFDYSEIERKVWELEGRTCSK
jgi:hypothetical protein